MAKEDGPGWMRAFFIVAVALAIVGFYAINLAHQKAKISSQLNAATNSLSQFTSSNAKSQQACIQKAQDTYAAAPAYFSNTSYLSETTSTCQAEYPTN